ncbi:MAG: protein phosphatase 2C domain-containing protein [Anaerolineae bacterium]|jgi:protein phosphatase|nr:protein phosphatase 2C domain-containing protein [Anaerolineae bacterium]
MIKMAKSHVPVAADTHAGMTGKNNEDNFLVSAYKISEENSARVLCAVLCDGVGGHHAGEIASEIGVNTITNVIAESNGQQFPTILKTAIIRASEEVVFSAKLSLDSDDEFTNRAGMGSTAAIAVLVGNRLYTATVGDSRIYLIRRGTIRQLSKDHTWIQDALEIGLITEEQVPGHPNNHVIRRYLGSKNEPEVDMRLYLHRDESDEAAEANQGTRLQIGDIILACSDGLSDLVPDKEIQQIVEELSDNLNEAVENLIDLANERGGHDNITIVTFSIPENVGMPQTEETYEPSTPEEKTQKKSLGCLPVILLPIIMFAASLITIF